MTSVGTITGGSLEEGFRTGPVSKEVETIVKTTYHFTSGVYGRLQLQLNSFQPALVVNFVDRTGALSERTAHSWRLEEIKEVVANLQQVVEYLEDRVNVKT